MKNIYIGMTSGYGPLAQALPIVEILKEDKNIGILTYMFSGTSRELLLSLGYKMMDLQKISLPKNVIPASREWWNLGFFLASSDT